MLLMKINFLNAISNTFIRLFVRVAFFCAAHKFLK